MYFGVWNKFWMTPCSRVKQAHQGTWLGADNSRWWSGSSLGCELCFLDFEFCVCWFVCWIFDIQYFAKGYSASTIREETPDPWFFGLFLKMTIFNWDFFPCRGCLNRSPWVSQLFLSCACLGVVRVKALKVLLKPWTLMLKFGQSVLQLTWTYQILKVGRLLERMGIPKWLLWSWALPWMYLPKHHLRQLEARLRASKCLALNLQITKRSCQISLRSWGQRRFCRCCKAISPCHAKPLKCSKPHLRGVRFSRPLLHPRLRCQPKQQRCPCQRLQWHRQLLPHLLLLRLQPCPRPSCRTFHLLRLPPEMRGPRSEAWIPRCSSSRWTRWWWCWAHECSLWSQQEGLGSLRMRFWQHYRLGNFLVYYSNCGVYKK